MKKTRTICSIVIGLIGLLNLCIWPTQVHAQESKKPDMKQMAGTYVLDQKRGITLMMFTKMTALEEGEVTVMEVVPILNVNLSRVDDAKKGIVFMEDDIEQSQVLYECTTFDVKWSEAEEVFEIAGFNGKKERLYHCKVKPKSTKRHGERPKPNRPTNIDEA